MFRLRKPCPLILLPFFAGPAYAHAGHGIEYSLTTLSVLLAFIFLLSKLYKND